MSIPIPIYPSSHFLLLDSHLLCRELHPPRKDMLVSSENSQGRITSVGVKKYIVGVLGYQSILCISWSPQKPESGLLWKWQLQM